MAIISGAKITSMTYFTSYERLKLGPKDLAQCSSLQAFDKFKFEQADDEKKAISLNLTQCWSDGDGSHLNGKVARTKLVTYGTKPDDKDLGKWVDEDIRPIPIKMELTPIVNLFTPTNLDERYNISSTDILDWFLPLYLKYCKVR